MLDYYYENQLNDRIRRLAYQKWKLAGCPYCEGVEFWLAAEKEVKESLKNFSEIIKDYNAN